jgi:hypothetical protein
VWDDASSPGQLAELDRGLRILNCPSPEIAAPVTVYALRVIGTLLESNGAGLPVAGLPATARLTSVVC